MAPITWPTLDAHDRRHLAVLGDGADRAAEGRALYQDMEAPHHHAGDGDHDDEERRDTCAEETEPPSGREEEVRHIDLHARALGQHDGVLQEDRSADRADQRAEPRGAADVERAIGEAFEQHAERAGAQHGRHQHQRQDPGRMQPADLGVEQRGEQRPSRYRRRS